MPHVQVGRCGSVPSPPTGRCAQDTDTALACRVIAAAWLGTLGLRARIAHPSMRLSGRRACFCLGLCPIARMECKMGSKMAWTAEARALRIALHFYRGQRLKTGEAR